ncbi:hypothetical protein FRC02_008048 [Tulasnella sp. 418]|nr:hypothetical protein FRC02_008048 [Tulasnella sp. 418]
MATSGDTLNTEASKIVPGQLRQGFIVLLGLEDSTCYWLVRITSSLGICCDLDLGSTFNPSTSHLIPTLNPPIRTHSPRLKDGGGCRRILSVDGAAGNRNNMRGWRGVSLVGVHLGLFLKLKARYSARFVISCGSKDFIGVRAFR